MQADIRNTRTGNSWIQDFCTTDLLSLTEGGKSLLAIGRNAGTGRLDAGDGWSTINVSKFAVHELQHSSRSREPSCGRI